MQVKTDDDRIVLTSVPFIQWLVGLIFFGIGLQLLIGLLLIGQSFNPVALVGGAIFGLVGLKLISAPYQKITIHRLLKTLTVKKIGLLNFGQVEYEADEIKKFYIESEIDSDKDEFHTIWLTLKSGQSLKLGTHFRSRSECETALDTIKRIYKPVRFPDQYEPKYL
jgi:hypothetical protein